MRYGSKLPRRPPVIGAGIDNHALAGLRSPTGGVECARAATERETGRPPGGRMRRFASFHLGRTLITGMGPSMWQWVVLAAGAWLVTACSAALVIGLIARRGDELDARMRDDAQVRKPLDRETGT